MNTTILYENGNTFLVTYRKSEKQEPNKLYANLGGVLCEIVSKEQKNTSTITFKDSLAVLHLDEITFQSLSYVPDLIAQLRSYNDDYSNKVVEVLTSYLNHKQFEKMRTEYDAIDSDDQTRFHNRWTLNIRLILCDVIYPNC